MAEMAINLASQNKNKTLTCIDGLFKWPRFEVVCLGSCPRTIMLALINRKASITTLKKTKKKQNVNSLLDIGA